MMENFADAVVKGVFMGPFVCSVVSETLDRGIRRFSRPTASCPERGDGDHGNAIRSQMADARSRDDGERFRRLHFP